jgi:restriction system protein
MIPKFSEYFLPFINVIKDGKIYTVKEIRDQIAKDLNLTLADLNEQTKGGRNKHEDRVKWVVTYMKKLDLIESKKKGLWKLSQKGEECLRSCNGNFSLNTLRDMQGYQDFIKDKSKSHWVEGHYRYDGTYVAGYASCFFSKGIRKINKGNI